MKHYKDELDKELQLLNNKFTISQKESNEVLTKINQRMNKKTESKKQTYWKYYVSSIVPVGLLVILAISLFNNTSSDIIDDNPQGDVNGKIPSKVEQGILVNSDYKEALRTANEFLIAWLHRDPQLGESLVTEELKEEKDPSELTAYFTGTSNPHHYSFEIVGKEKVDKDIYQFYIWMYEYYTGYEDESTVELNHDNIVSTLEVVKVDENEFGEGIWKVNNLP